MAPKGSAPKIKGKKDHAYTNGPGNLSAAAQICLDSRGFLLFKLLDAAVKRANLSLRVVINQLLLNMYTTTFNKYLLSTYYVPDSVLDA